jgi:hypothetical protein
VSSDARRSHVSEAPQPPNPGPQDAWLKPERVAGLLIAFGVALRLRLYFANFSLEVAEAQLSLNLLERSYAELLQPLAGDQAAPIGFLLVKRLALDLLGNQELVLRLFPMLCGIASLFLFRGLAKRILPPFAAHVALGLFAISPQVIHFSSQVKQYSSDVAVTIFLLLAATWARKRLLDAPSVAVLSVSGAVAIWFSHPAIFVLGGIGAAWACSELFRRRYDSLAKLSLCGAVWGASFVALYLISLQHVTSNSFLMSYWGRAFMPLPPTSIDDLKWFPETFFGTFRDPGGLFTFGLAAASFAIGVDSLARRDPEACAMLVAPVLLALLASGLGRFPFSGRVILFVVPVLLLFIGEGIDRVRRLTWSATPAITLVLVGVLVFDPLVSQTLRLLRPRTIDDPRSVFAYLGGRIQNGDEIYLYNDAISLFRYYAPRFGLGDRPYVMGSSAESNWEVDVQDLQALRGRPRVWLVFTHIHGRDDHRSEEDFFVFELNRMGRQLDSFRAPDAAVYLYDLARPPSAEAPH